MQLVLQDILPFITSTSSIFAADIVETIQIMPSPQDTLHVIRGIGGTEVVIKRCVDFIAVNDFHLPNFEIEVGGMEYGFEINGILGMDFLISSGAIINPDFAIIAIIIASKAKI